MQVKAFAWVETGPNNRHWNDRVLQIGNRGDPGLDQILNSPTGKMIVPPQYRPFLNETIARTVPLFNIQAGVGYLLWISAIKRLGDVPVDASTSAFPGWPAPLEPASRPVQTSAFFQGGYVPSPRPKTRKAQTITGWRTIDHPLIAKHYNGGDGNYLGKLDHAYDVVVRGVPEPSGVTK